MKSSNSKSELKLEKTAEPKSLLHLALDAADRGQSTAVAVLQDARVEVRAAIENGIELAEKLSAGALRFARKLVTKLDEASNDALTGTERALSAAVDKAKETSTRPAPELSAAA
ncbi:MAG: hypothetical protein H0T46_19245 [Deltaproteobacteria bacterium]|nr:hypothetical protein [Deltaproteobacteria bacterium]